MKYTVLDLVAGSSDSHAATGASTIREARSIAWHRARRLRPPGQTARPTWCGGGSWHEHPDAPGLEPVGGYDVGDDGSATVIFAEPIDD